MNEGLTFYFDWEIALMQFLQETLGSFGASICALISNLGEEIALIIVWGLVYWCIDKDFGRRLGLGLCVGIVASPMIKNVFLRRRPYFDNPTIKCFKPVDAKADIYDISAQGYSFPSIHSTNSVLVYGGLASYLKKKIFVVLGTIIPILVAISRVVVGVHYPTDVLVGLFIGILILALTGFLYKKAKRRWILYAVIFALSCLGMIYCRSTDYYTALGFMGGFFAGDLFEASFVRFENTHSIPKIVLRTVFGFAIFLGLNAFLKIPFSKEFLDSATMGAYLIRMIRYLIVTFVIVGIYPLTFRRFLK